MSGRGRGRGRGGGRGFSPPTGAQLFLRRTAEECGLDAHNLRSLQDITRPSLFPEILLHSSGDQRRLQAEQAAAAAAAQSQSSSIGVKREDGKGSSSSSSQAVKSVPRTAATVFLISKGRELHHRMQNSALYVRPTKDVPDVIRYSDRKRPPAQIDASTVLSHCLGGRKRTKMGRFVPEELVKGQQLSISALGLSAADIDNSNESEVENKKKDTEEEEGEGEEELGEEEGEEEDGEDYVTNYYESEGDESDGGNDEPTF